MAKVAILQDNLIDAAAVTASAAAPFLPAALLQNAHVARAWETPDGTTSAVLTADLKAQKPVDLVALAGVPLVPATASWRIRLATGDSSGQTGDSYDSGTVAPDLDPRYAQAVHLLPTTATGRYLRIDLADAGLTRLRAGRWIAGALHRFQHNYAFDASIRTVDTSERSEGDVGQLFHDLGQVYRVARLTFPRLRQDERYGVIEALDRLNATHRDFLLCLDPDSDNLSRDCLWGVQDETTEVSNPHFQIYRKQIRIRERL